MLNLSIAMFPILFSLLLVLFAQTAELSISSPKAGQTLLGKVEIVGSMDVPNFSSAQLAFTYFNSTGDASIPADNWFAIQTFSQPVKDAVLSVWDTRLLTDGDYTLRLRVFLLDGSFQDVVVADLKIGNDLPTPTNVPPTATATLIPPPPAPSAPPATAIPKKFFTATPSPVNPASVTTFSIYSTFGRGALITLVLFIVFSLLLRLRKN